MLTHAARPARRALVRANFSRGIKRTDPGFNKSNDKFQGLHRHAALDLISNQFDAHVHVRGSKFLYAARTLDIDSKKFAMKED